MCVHVCVCVCVCVIVGKSIGRHQDMVIHKVRYGHSLNKRTTYLNVGVRSVLLVISLNI